MRRFDPMAVRPPLTAPWAALCASLLLAACAETPADPAGAALPSATAASADTAVRAAPTADAAGIAPDAAPVGLPGDAVRDFLVARYGALAQLAGDWPGTPLTDAGLGDAAALRDVCVRAPVGEADAPAELVVVCGLPDGAGHVTPAITDFFLLRRDGDTIAAAAESHQQTFGSFGDLADIAVHRVGAKRYGVVIESGFTGQGITLGTRDIVLPRDGGFAAAASLRSTLDNAGWMSACLDAGTCAAEDAFDLQFDLDLDDSRSAAEVYPLLVRERGTACGRRIDATYRLAFDAATGAWPVPAALQRDGCD
ncbi:MULTISPECIES: hypothetical protein [Luteimonas]|uniref:hypothetical protein n=1 Tax=Luteimonas TaxID=83614 RepID=UPI000C7CBE6E|nr:MULTISPECIES: hypothetical protein [Luteimonas]